MKRFTTILLMAISSVSVFATTYTVTDGYSGSIMTIENNDTLIMTGGGLNRVNGKGNGILNISNTSSPYVYGESGIHWMSLKENSQLYFSGGSLHLLEMTDNVSVVLAGGQIDEINAYYPAPGNLNHITIYCKPDWTYQNQYLSGQWLDGSAFNIRLYSQGKSGVFDNITFIPEPTTMLLLGLGGLLIRRKIR
jgi:hypothetical protein